VVRQPGLAVVERAAPAGSCAGLSGRAPKAAKKAPADFSTNPGYGRWGYGPRGVLSAGREGAVIRGGHASESGISYWVSAAQPGQCCAGALLLKLDSAGNLQWQKALSGGLYCFFNGFNETCANLGAVAYSAHQTSDGGYVLTGNENLKLTDSVPLEPWIAKVDTSGNLLWQHLYYQTNPASRRPLGENFSSSVATTDGGFYAGGFTENVNNGDAEFYAVKTDSSGLAGSTCGDTHPGTTLNSVNPALTAKVTNVPVSSVIASVSSSPATTSATSVSTQTDC